MIMVCGSMAELFIQYKVIWIALKSLFHQACISIDGMLQKRGKNVPFFAKHSKNEDLNPDVIKDPARPEDQVKDWMWILGLVVTVVIAMVICQIQWVSN
jgi:hypothetical protein